MYFRRIRLKMSKGKIKFIFIESVLKFMLPFGLAYLIFLGNIEALEPNADKLSVSIFMRELILTIVVFTLIGILKGSVEWYCIERYLKGDKKGNVKWIKRCFFLFIWIY